MHTTSTKQSSTHNHSNLDNFRAKSQKVIAKLLMITLLVLDVPVVPLFGSSNTAQAAALVTPREAWVSVTPRVDATMQNLNIPANAATQGMWSAPFAWPMNGLHNMILPDGKVLTFGTNANGDAQDGRTFDIWDPSLGFGANSHNTSYQAAQQDSFCGTATYLNDGNMLITGGNSGNGGFGKGSLIYNPVNNTRATAQAVTALPRWYSLMLGLPDGRKLVMGGMVPYTEGMYNDPAGAIARGEPSMTPEIYENGAWRSLLSANSRLAFGPDFLRTSFPHAFVAPNGQVFGISADRMWYLDVNANSGAGAVNDFGQFKPVSGNNPDPNNAGALSVAVMYDIGKIIQVGGNGGFNGDGFPASNKATSIDINGGAPVLTELPRMAFPRRLANGIVLANGEVVISGGTRQGNDAGGNELYAAEIWNPRTNAWLTTASAATIRVYHSATSLLLNGAIISTGGGTPGPIINKTGEVYYPPYLFEQVGGASRLAARPAIRGISGLKYAHGATMQMDMDSAAAINGLVLVGLSNGTHGFNSHQRRIPLQFTQEDNRLTATIPNANLTPPGYYQVVALNAQGVPSYANVIAVGSQMAAPQVATTAYDPGITTPPTANLPPTVSLSAPTAGTAYTQGATVAITATAADSDGSVAYVDFYDGGSLLGSDTTAPYAFDWVTSASTATGSHSITAAAVDNTGARTISEVRNVTINAPTVTGNSVNIAPSATLATSYVSPWETLTAVNNNSSHTSSADKNGGAYGNWNGDADFGKTNWVSFSWSEARTLNAFEVYWWNDGLGIATPNEASVEYWNGSTWTPLGAIGLSLNQYNRIDFAQITTTSIRVLMKSALSTGILEARIWETNAVTPPAIVIRPTASTPVTYETRVGATGRVWVVNPDNDSVSVLDAATNTLVREIPVGSAPRTLAIAPNGNIWVANKGSATISVVSPTTLAVVQTIAMPRASQPYGLAFAPNGTNAYVVLEALGQISKLDPVSGALVGTLALGNNPRHVSVTADSATVLVSRFITPALPGEATANVDTAVAGAEVVAVNAGAMTLNRTIVLRHSDKADTTITGSGIPNYLGAAVISPDGSTAWVPSKQDNIKRGIARNGQPLNFQNTVRAISSNINMSTLTEDLARRIDHDNSSLGSAAVYHPSGNHLFVALETSREVAVIDPVTGVERFRINVGRAPQGLALSPDGNTLYVQEFMDRSVGVFDLRPLVQQGTLSATSTGVVFTVTAASEKLPANVVLGKQLFYDAKDPRLSLDSYMSCASCHNDGGHDGRVWDLTGFGEGLRNTIALKGRTAMGHGNLHWSANFDELQDFEGQIRTLAGGRGLMTDAQFNTGTRNQPLGDRKVGVSADLDNLAAYVASLNTFAQSPNRNTDGTLTTAATAGRTVFGNSCASCHGGTNFTQSSDVANLRNIGTINALSGQRLGAVLTGIDVPTLRDAWATAPYLHNGSAATVTAAVQAHNNLALNATDLANVVAFVQQIGSEEAAVTVTPPSNVAPTVAITAPTTGTAITRGATLAITATAADSDGTVARVEFYDGTTLLGTDTTAPYAFSWVTTTSTTTGTRSLTARAFDNIGAATTSAAVSVTVNAPANVAPTVALTAPVAGSTITQGATVAITATAADSDGTVARVEFYDGTTLLGTDTTAPYAFSWVTTTSTTTGTRSLTARAFDNIGAATTSAAVSVTVNAPANVAPTVALTAPVAGSTITQGATVAITATAADSDGTVARVEFYDGTTLLGTDTTAPYAFSWVTTTSTTTGTRSLTARAFDNTGAATTSAAVSVTVNAPTPPTTSVLCASENGTCRIPTGRTATVWYGANTSWVVRTGVTLSIGCNNSTFGDPIRGTVKSCRYLAN